jgi:hypothetical protein
LTVRAKAASGCGPSLPSTFPAGPMPAQLTSPCRPPKRLTARSTAACARGLLGGDVGAGEGGALAERGGERLALARH